MFCQDCSANSRLLQQLIIIYVLGYRNKLEEWRCQEEVAAKKARFEKSHQNTFGSRGIITGSFCSSRRQLEQHDKAGSLWLILTWTADNLSEKIIFSRGNFVPLPCNSFDTKSQICSTSAAPVRDGGKLPLPQSLQPEKILQLGYDAIVQDASNKNINATS